MSRYAMVVDLKRCVGCHACTVACKAEHNTPNGVMCTSVLEKEYGKFPNVTRVFIPVLCNHCEEPVCVDVCPTGASDQREDGVVLIDWDKCIGCKACISACPYDMRYHVKDNRILFSDGKTSFSNPAFKSCPTKVPVKCDFCIHRIDKGELKPACVEVCPTEARQFGDRDNPESQIHKIQTGQYPRTLMTDKGTKPQVFYVNQQQQQRD